MFKVKDRIIYKYPGKHTELQGLKGTIIGVGGLKFGLLDVKIDGVRTPCDDFGDGWWLEVDCCELVKE